MLAVWSQLEADMCSERTRDGLAAVRAKGKRLGAVSMVESIGPDGERRLDPEKAALVRRVQAVAQERSLSLRRLVAYLNAEGIPSVKGKAWHVKTLRTALEFRFTTPE